ncbi:hypothetical protein TNCV_1218921 [Trichonephila clavipes]|nr:hypothetical protein TNCV_1218921 [Trichonephila clavipes]
MFYRIACRYGAIFMFLNSVDIARLTCVNSKLPSTIVETNIAYCVFGGTVSICLNCTSPWHLRIIMRRKNAAVKWLKLAGYRYLESLLVTHAWSGIQQCLPKRSSGNVFSVSRSRRLSCSPPITTHSPRYACPGNFASKAFCPRTEFKAFITFRWMFRISSISITRSSLSFPPEKAVDSLVVRAVTRLQTGRPGCDARCRQITLRVHTEPTTGRTSSPRQRRISWVLRPVHYVSTGGNRDNNNNSSPNSGQLTIVAWIHAP